MFDLGNLLKFIISVSDLGRGKASRIINEVSENKHHYLVIKNNKPEAVIVPVEDYIKYTEAMEDIALLSIAESRIKYLNPAEAMSHEKVLAQYGLTDEDLDGIDVEIE